MAYIKLTNAMEDIRMLAAKSDFYYNLLNYKIDQLNKTIALCLLKIV